MKVGAVDADQHKSLASQYGIRGFPTIKIFGANKNKPEDYQGKCLIKAVSDGLSRISLRLHGSHEVQHSSFSFTFTLFFFSLSFSGQVVVRVRR